MVNEILGGSSEQRFKKRGFLYTISKDLAKSLEEKRYAWKLKRYVKAKKVAEKKKLEQERIEAEKAEEAKKQREKLCFDNEAKDFFENRLSFSQLLVFFMCFSGRRELGVKDVEEMLGSSLKSLHYRLFPKYFSVYKCGKGDKLYYNYVHSFYSYESWTSLTAGAKNETRGVHRELPYNIKDILKIMLSKELTSSDVTLADIRDFFDALDSNKSLSQVTKSYYKTRFINKFREIGFSV